MDRSDNCGECSQSVGALQEQIQCDGGCEKVYHLSCTTMNLCDLQSCIGTDNLLWMCDACLILFRRQRSIAWNNRKNTGNSREEINERNMETTVGQLQLDIENLRRGFLDLKQYVKESHGTDSRRTDSRETDSRVMPTTSTPRAHVNEEQSMSHSNHSEDSRLFRGSNAEIPSSNESRKYWIYFTRVAKHVTCDQMRTMVSRALQVNDQPDVIKLCPRWRCLEELRYVSFKVGVDWRHKIQASLESTWPAGLMYREFVSREPDFWQP